MYSFTYQIFYTRATAFPVNISLKGICLRVKKFSEHKIWNASLLSEQKVKANKFEIVYSGRFGIITHFIINCVKLIN